MHRCECSDPSCKHPKPGREPIPRCMTRSSRLVRLYRLDMLDPTGTDMCAHCTSDALESGLFTTYKPH
jgi:hypothetical protein